MRHGCPLIVPCLFILLLVDVDEVLGKRRWEGDTVGGRKVVTLTFAVGFMILAEEEEEIKG